MLNRFCSTVVAVTRRLSGRNQRPSLLILLSVALFAQCKKIEARPRPATPETAQAMLAAARSGDRITLGPGVYSELRLQGKKFEPAIQIDARAATIRGLQLKKVSGVMLRGGRFEVPPPRPNPRGGRPVYGSAVRLDNVSEFEVTGATFAGPAALAPSPDTFGDGYGVFVRSGLGITLVGNNFAGFKSGVVLSRVEGFRVEANSFTAMRSDGVQVAESRRGVVSNNQCSATKIRDNEHPDCIQLWSRPTSPPTSDVAIKRNVVRGPTQGISAFNHKRNGVDDGGFDRILIEDNDVEVGYPHGIALIAARDSAVRNNNVRTFAGARWQARITIVGDAVRCGNTVAAAAGKTGVRDSACN